MDFVSQKLLAARRRISYAIPFFIRHFTLSSREPRALGSVAEQNKEIGKTRRQNFLNS